MLERKCNNVLRSLELNVSKALCQPFRDDHLDPSHGLAGIPPILREKFIAETGKSQEVVIPGSIRIYDRN